MEKQYDFTSVYQYKGTRRLLLNGKWGLVDENYQIIIPIEYEKLMYFTDYILVRKDNLFGLLDFNGKQILATEYDDINYAHYKENIFSVKRNGLYSIFNSETGEFTEYKYKHAVTLVDIPIIIESTNGFGVIDNSLKELVPCKYESLTPLLLDDVFGEAVLFAKDAEGAYIINYNDVVLKTVEYEDMKCFYTTKLLPVKVNGLWGLIDRDFNYVVTPTYFNITKIANDSGILFKISTSYACHGLMDMDGKIIVPPMYSSIHNGYNNFIVCNGEHYGIIDFKGNPITKFKFDQIFVYCDYYKCRIDGLCGMLDLKGTQIIPNEYHNVSVLNDGFVVEKHTSDDEFDYQLLGICDNTGKLVSKIIYEGISAIDCKAKQATVHLNGETGIYKW